VLNHRDEASQAYALKPSFHSRLCKSFEACLASGVPESGKTALAFKHTYLAGSYLSKYCELNPDTAKERHDRAISKWRIMELRNARSNQRLFAEWLTDARFNTKHSSISALRITEIARRNILQILGDKPSLDVLYGTFSGGASMGFRKFAGNVAAKFKAGATVTEACLPLFQDILAQCETWKLYRGALHPEIVGGGSLFTVPKNSEIDRCAVKEPDLNMFCQKGVGDFIRNRLRSVARIDLNDQSRNQRLARKGSIDGSLATLDLSSASDLISDGLVRLLLPEAWFDLLNAVRSQNVLCEGVWTELNMFSSMGNGFTFELESLLFYSIARAVAYLTGTRGAISVYGDDIIVPSAIGGLLSKVLYWYGMKVNTDKSYWKGPFRESCGKHWYSGVDVTPFYVKESIDSVEKLIHFLNRLRRWAILPGFSDTCDPHFEKFFSKWSRYVPTCLYGGYDLARKDSLVTTHKPRMKLVRLHKVVKPDAAGAYLQWLRLADDRKTLGEPIITSSVTVELSGFRLRRNACTGIKSIPTFPGEGDV